MKSIKPGRGPSMMGGVMNIFAAAFGVLWMIVAASMGGGFFALFGLFFISTASRGFKPDLAIGRRWKFVLKH